MDSAEFQAVVDIIHAWSFELTFSRISIPLDMFLSFGCYT